MLGQVALAATSSLGDVPKQIDYHDARITDVGVVAVDVLQWAEEDPVTHKVDTVYTTEQYILWQSDGDIDEQAEMRRAAGPKVGDPRKATTTGKRSGSLMSGWLATYEYMVFKYEYPSVSADGSVVTLSAIAACPTKGGCKETRDVVIGTHITITANRECPSNTTAGFDSQDWGILMSLAGGQKIKFGWKTNLVMGAVTLVCPIIGGTLWGTLGISTEVTSAEPSNNYNLVILPDYEGYGLTSGRSHPYLYQELTARQVVDATRYGIALYNNDPATSSFRHPLRSDFRSLTCGYSQGGSVALATHRFIEQNGLAEELHFVGSICGDGPYDPMATLMYYVKNDLENKKMSMAVVLPLIIKGMLDSNPYMKSHKASDYFRQEFLDTGIMGWLNDKNMSTDDIENAWAQMAKNGQTTIFDTNGHALMRNIMNQECYSYFAALYEQNKNTFTQAAGVPLPTHRGTIEDLHFALASNDLTMGWVPQHTIMLFHSTDDTVVPYENFTRVSTGLSNEGASGWVKTHTSRLGHDHVDSGTDFFKSDDNWELAGELSLRVFIAKDKLTKLHWRGQTTSSMSAYW